MWWLLKEFTLGIGIAVVLYVGWDALTKIWEWFEAIRIEHGERAKERLKIRAAELMNEAEKLRQAQLFKVNFRRADDESEQ